MSHPQRAKRNQLPAKPAPASKADLAALRKEMRALTEVVTMANGLSSPTSPSELVEEALNAFAAETSGRSPLSADPSVSPVEARLGDGHACTYSFTQGVGAYSTKAKADAAGVPWAYPQHNTLKAGIEAVLRVLYNAGQKERANDQG